MASKIKQIGIKGSGYFCDVYKFQHEETGEFVAIKRLKEKHYENDDYRYRLIREIKLLTELKGCPNIVDLLRDGNNKEKKQLWYMMPCADYNLYKYIKKNAQKITLEERFKFADQIINAIKFAHGKNILHRDISPNNVLLFDSGEYIEVKVSDFGLGKDEVSLSHYTGSSADGYGQILYVSPEQREKLKDATIQSDIFSLGKLIYFLFTAKDPDNLKPFILSPLVSRATDEVSSKRHKSIEEFEKHYMALKQLQLDQEIPVEYLSIKDVLGSKDKIDWNLFHQIALKGKTNTHVFSDFLEPIVSVLSEISNIREYYNEVGNDFKYFINQFSEKVYECIRSIGWPFSATSSFGTLLKNFVINVNDPEVRLVCLKLMWDLAFVSDQWSVQSDIKPLLNKKYISDDIEISLADHIQSNPLEIHVSDFEQYKLPQIIKKSIILANENHKKQESEKYTEPDEWNF